ncbi:polymeric immunoglobulin receptor-like [Hippoglossus hippoglossus]|uniref:polymeric immunoglobulin receptor-like n=1 Tax=Hippoglossus hippoglossus TaxID=8267 RepID=UPI00148B8170|nr:polymeric immunoglobulin receptor-like [Hippoglossus hippoglossus]
MNVCYTLICCFFLYVDSAEIYTYSANEGEDITVKYSFSSYGSRKFCRGACEAGDILIDTDRNEARNGRYSIKYERGVTTGDLTVTITQLSKSDSGTYRCGLGSLSSLYQEFQIIVTDAQLEGSSEVKQLYKRSGGDVTVECVFTNTGGRKYFCREECGERMNVLVTTRGDEERSGRYSIKYLTGSEGRGFLFVTITQLIRSDSGRYTCSVGSDRDFEVIVTDDSTTTSPSSSSSSTRSSASPETTNQSLVQTPETTDVDSAEIYTYSANEGEDITVKHSFSSYGSRKFCRGACEAGDILIDTDRNEARNGRYSIKYERGVTTGDLTVTITQLSKSDSGTYRCGLGRLSSLYQEFQIIVTDAQLEGSSEVKQLYKRSGGDVTVECVFTNTGGRKYFCREECGERMNVLVTTRGDEERSGRYSILYLTGSGRGFLFVTITQLIRSDSGRYRCSVSEESHRDFEVIVTDDSTTTSPSSSSSSTRSSASPETTNQSLVQTPETTGGDKDVILTVGVTLVVMVVLLSGAALMFCRKRSNRPREAPVETDPASVSEPGPVYEDLRDEGRPPAAVEISPDYSNVTYSTTQPVRAGDDDNFVTAAASQHKADDSSGSLTYAQVNFSNRATGSANSPPPPGDDDVVYSVLQKMI